MERASERDRAVVEQQIGRRPRAVRRIAVRCPFGRPAVTEQEPYDEAGVPFPTTFYLTCPHAVAVIARLEATGAVERWSERAAADPLLRASLERATAEQRELRTALAAGRVGNDGGASLGLGIGGSSSTAGLKCLHAHVAFALARPDYLLGRQLLEELAEPLFPADRCCI